MQKESEKNYLLRFILAVLGLTAVILAAFLTSLAVRSRAAEDTLPVDGSVVESLMALEDADVGEAVFKMQSVCDSRDASVRESVSASASESEAESLSIAYEQSSLVAESESIEQAAYEASVAEASRAAEQAVMDAWLAGSHLSARHVSFACDDTDIPYIRKLFSYCIVLGNSRAKNAVDCGIFSENEIKFQSGVSVDVFTPFALNAAYMYKPKTLFVLGLNDIGHYDGSNERFYQDYKSLIQQYKAINPYGTIYLSEILPCPEEARPYFYRFFMIPDFNARIRQVCEEEGCIYVSASPYADFKYINSEDHAHYGKEFYFLWAQTMATQMHLWEDASGLGYEIPYDLMSDPELPVLENTVTETDTPR